ncbi:hypothetical protein EVAR_83413_1 [Eumeta japonica]|uniref:Uncharacterized protein n=1 Tax=Eumeta variegata TaxID=151549 RepID=A0A4C1TYM7_EUMVA|nr:hypothetical protein EVAR_83413_1 [Eumeta japonica]
MPISPRPANDRTIHIYTYKDMYMPAHGGISFEADTMGRSGFAIPVPPPPRPAPVGLGLVAVRVVWRDVDALPRLISIREFGQRRLRRAVLQKYIMKCDTRHR